jgi:hypothetical protein
MADDLLPRVDVYRLSAQMREELVNIVNAAVRAALEEQGLTKRPAPEGALRGRAAAKYIGISPSHFYDLLKKDPALAKLSYQVGKSPYVEGLNQWMRNRTAQPVAGKAA